jgi:hypothetical protein
MGKYDALADHLRRSPASRLQLTFEQLADLVPGGVPPSAYRHAAWWANEADGTHVHAWAWMGTGWRVDLLDLARHRVTFVRNQAAGS